MVMIWQIARVNSFPVLVIAAWTGANRDVFCRAPSESCIAKRQLTLQAEWALNPLDKQPQTIHKQYDVIGFNPS